MSEPEQAATGQEPWEQLRHVPGVASLPLPWPVATATRLGVHASRRRFYRLAPESSDDASTVVLVLYEEDDADEVARYERTATWLTAAGARVPEVMGRSNRALLVEDCGDRLLAAEPGGAGLVALYRAATRTILAVQDHGRHAEEPNPDRALDGDRLRAELDFTERHALRGWLEASPSGLRDAAFDRLADAVAASPQVLCHRDYHSRNLLVRDAELFVLDFQDIMRGPLFYDLASLLRDDYRDVPVACAGAALETFQANAASAVDVEPAANVPAAPEVLEPGPRQAFWLAAAQRSLKALGTFGYQVNHAGRLEYATYARRTWRHAHGALEQLGWHELLGELEAFDRL